MPEDACDIFLMWHRATETGEWNQVLDTPLTQETYLAALMLKNHPALRYKLAGI